MSTTLMNQTGIATQPITGDDREALFSIKRKLSEVANEADLAGLVIENPEAIRLMTKVADAIDAIRAMIRDEVQGRA